MTNRHWIIRENDPFDDGYWDRFDGKPRPSGAQQQAGWDACDKELAEDASTQSSPHGASHE